MPILLLTYALPKRARPSELDWTFGSVAFIRVRCPVLQFRLMDPTPHLASENVSALALSSLMSLDRQQQVEAIVKTLAEALQQKLSEAELEAAAAFVRHYAPLDAEQLLQLRERVSRVAAENKSLYAMPTLVNPFVEIGKLEGIEKGERQLALRLVQRKFPAAPAIVAQKIEELDEEGLLSLAEALPSFQSEDECLTWLEKR